MSTIRDIARQAGVAVSTASLALNGNARVRPVTRQRVLDAAEALNYHPLRAAKSLSSGRTCALQLLNPVGDGALSSGFFTRFLRGIHDTAREAGYSVALSVLDDENEAEELVERLTAERWSDGVILMNPSASPQLEGHLSSRSFPFVVLGRATVESVLSVDNDNVQVAFDATRHLLRYGGPVLLLNGPSQQTFTQDRAAGYRKALGGAFEPLICSVPGTAGEARAEVSRLLAEGPAFRSVLAVSDATAIGAMRALRTAGKCVPEDVAVMGMNNDDVAEYTDPRLSSVELGATELGCEAATLLLHALADEPVPSRRRLVAHHLVLRESA